MGGPDRGHALCLLCLLMLRGQCDLRELANTDVSAVDTSRRTEAHLSFCEMG